MLKFIYLYTILQLEKSIVFTMAKQTQWDRASSISRIHDQLHTPHKVEQPWMSYQPDKEAST